MEKTEEETKTEAESQPEPKTNRAYKFIIGFVIAIALLIFVISSIALAIRVIPNTFALIAGTFSSVSNESLDHDFSVSDTLIDSEESVLFVWKELLEDGQYSLTFICSEDDGVSLEYQSDFIDCQKPLLIGQGENKAEVTLISKEKRFLDIPVILEFEDDRGAITTIDEVEVTVSNKSPEDGSVLGTDVEITSEEKPTPVTTTARPFRDLSVRILESGEVSGIARLVFEIRNNGNTSSGPWSFQAFLPVSDSSQRIFNSGLQNSIGPGGATVYTLSFSGLQTGNALIVVDNQNLIGESNEFNNQASVSFNAGTSFSGDDADFDIDLIAIGRMSGSRFIETNNLDVRDKIAIQFRVTNRGGRTTEDWRFEVDIDEPSGADDLDFTSRRYDELSPGESRTVTITFDDLEEDGDYDFEIEVDSERDTDEETRSNNRIRFDIDIDR